VEYVWGGGLLSSPQAGGQLLRKESRSRRHKGILRLGVPALGVWVDSCRCRVRGKARDLGESAVSGAAEKDLTCLGLQQNRSLLRSEWSFFCLELGLAGYMREGSACSFSYLKTSETEARSLSSFPLSLTLRTLDSGLS
jgi:hypothetical protein